MRFFSVGLIPKLLCFQGQRPEVCLAQPIGLVTPMQLKTANDWAVGPTIYLAFVSQVVGLGWVNTGPLARRNIAAMGINLAQT